MNSNTVTPIIAIAAANIQDLKRDKSPILTQSETAPIVQKLVLHTTNPRINPNIDMYDNNKTEISMYFYLSIFIFIIILAIGNISIIFFNYF